MVKRLKDIVTKHTKRTFYLTEEQVYIISRELWKLSSTAKDKKSNCIDHKKYSKTVDDAYNKFHKEYIKSYRKG